MESRRVLVLKRNASNFYLIKKIVLLDVRFYFPFTFLLQFCIIITICWPMVCAVYTLLLCFLFFGIYVFFGGFCTLLFFSYFFHGSFCFLVTTTGFFLWFSSRHGVLSSDRAGGSSIDLPLPLIFPSLLLDRLPFSI